MPGIKRKARAGRTARRPRKMARQVARVPARRYRPQSLVSVRRTFWLENWTLSSAAVNGFWRYYQFLVTQMPSFTEFQGVFDRYRINGIKVVFRPRYSISDGSNTTDTTPPGVTNQATNLMHIIVDPYSNLTPTGTYTSANLNTFLENGKVRTYQGNRPISVYFKPVFDEGSMAGTGNRKRARWFLTNGAHPVHTGFHAFQQDVNLTGTTSQSFDVFVTFYMQFANLR